MTAWVAGMQLSCALFCGLLDSPLEFGALSNSEVKDRGSACTFLNYPRLHVFHFSFLEYETPLVRFLL